MPIHLRNGPNGLVPVEGPTPDPVVEPGLRTSPAFTTIRVSAGSVALDTAQTAVREERWRITLEGDLSTTDPETATAELLGEVLRRLMR